MHILYYFSLNIKGALKDAKKVLVYCRAGQVVFKGAKEFGLIYGPNF